MNAPNSKAQCQTRVVHKGSLPPTSEAPLFLPVTHAIWLCKGTLILSAWSDGSLRTFDPSSGDMVRVFSSVKWEDGRGERMMEDPVDQVGTPLPAGPPRKVLCMTPHPWCSPLALISYDDGAIQLWDASAANLLQGEDFRTVLNFKKSP